MMALLKKERKERIKINEVICHKYLKGNKGDEFYKKSQCGTPASRKGSAFNWNDLNGKMGSNEETELKID
jgi:hypothetical protein